MHEKLLEMVCLATAMAASTPAMGQVALPASEPVPPAAAHRAGAVNAVDDARLAQSACATKLIKSRVYANDVAVGEIEDILIEGERSALMAAVIPVGGFLGLGQKWIAIPINQLNLGSEARFTIDMSNEELRNAPALDFTKLK